jgi:hypothetical protein
MIIMINSRIDTFVIKKHSLVFCLPENVSANNRNMLQNPLCGILWTTDLVGRAV